MGYYDDVKKAKAFDMKIMKDAKLGAEAKKMSANSELQNKLRRTAELNYKSGKLEAASKLIPGGRDAALRIAPQIAEEYADVFMENSQPGSLGMSQSTSEGLGDAAIMEKALAVVDTLDAEQAKGVPPSELAKQFNQLPPQIKSVAQKIKESRIAESKQGSRPNNNIALAKARPSEITKGAQSILGQTLNIGVG